MKIEIELFHIILSRSSLFIFYSHIRSAYSQGKLKRVGALIALVFLYRFRLHFNRVHIANYILLLLLEKSQMVRIDRMTLFMYILNSYR